MAIDPFGDMSALASEPRDAVRLSADRGRGGAICCWSRTSTSTTTAWRRSAASPRSCARPRASWSRRSARSRRSPPSTTRRPAPNAGPTRSSCSSSTALRVCHFGDFGQSELRDEQAAAIGADRPADHARRRWSHDRRASRPRRSSSVCSRAGSCRCTTARRASASWRPPTRSWSATRTSSACGRRPSRPRSCPPRTVPLVVVPAAP